MLAVVGEDDGDGTVYVLKELGPAEVMAALQKTIAHDCTNEEARAVLTELEAC